MYNYTCTYPFRRDLPTCTFVFQHQNFSCCSPASKIYIYSFSFTCQPPGCDHHIILNKHLSGSSRLDFSANVLFLFFPCAVRNQITENLDYVMTLSVWSGSRLSDFNQSFFSVSSRPGFQSYLIMYVHTNLHTRSHTHTSHQVSKRCSDLTGNGPVVWIPISLPKCLHFNWAACFDSQVPLCRLLDHN